MSIPECKCFLWMPLSSFEEIHLYLLVEDARIKPSFFQEKLDTINVEINITDLDERHIMETIIIKNIIFKHSELRFVAKSWTENYIKYEFPEKVIHKQFFDNNKEKGDRKVMFYISNSNLISSRGFENLSYDGSLNFKLISEIEINELYNLSIKKLKTKKYIGKMAANLLEITVEEKGFCYEKIIKNITSSVDLILAISSLAEKRRLDWFKFNAAFDNCFLTHYNCRKYFFNDPENERLIDFHVFEKFIENGLKRIEKEKCGFLFKLIKPYVSTLDYSIGAKILLWNSLLESWLKFYGLSKADKNKEASIQERGIYTRDLSSIKDLVDFRNEYAHGDFVNKPTNIKLLLDWEKLMDRIMLKELKWNFQDSTACLPKN